MTTTETEKDYRNALAEVMDRSVADQAKYGNWRYVFARPQDVRIDYTSHTVRPDVDCGDGCRVLCYTVMIKDDPAGNGYSNYGNSSSIFWHLHRESNLALAEVGDILTFGFTCGEHHAAMVRTPNLDLTKFRLWNMGTQGEPIFSSLASEKNYHAGMTVTLCKLNLPPDPKPTHEDVLRAMTGYYAWAAWRLGEGVKLWKPYGPVNVKVRPDVPKVIPTKWWVDLNAFLANRNKGNVSRSRS